MLVEYNLFPLQYLTLEAVILDRGIIAPKPLSSWDASIPSPGGVVLMLSPLQRKTDFSPRSFVVLGHSQIVDVDPGRISSWLLFIGILQLLTLGGVLVTFSVAKALAARAPRLFFSWELPIALEVSMQPVQQCTYLFKLFLRLKVLRASCKLA